MPWPLCRPLAPAQMLSPNSELEPPAASALRLLAVPSSLHSSAAVQRERSASNTYSEKTSWGGESCATIDVILGKEEHMAESTLDQVQRLVEQLSPHEQAHLLASLALRMAQAVTATSHPASITPPEPTEAWEEFFRLGDALAASDTPAAETLTAAVLAMRR
jgi:hypothetical protein